MREIIYPNPANIASEPAEKLVTGRHLDEFNETSNEEQRAIIELEALAEAAGMTNHNYFVSSGRAIMIPNKFDANDPSVPYVNFGEGLDFHGEFVTYATVRIGKISHGAGVRALCLAFGGTTLLPYFDRVPSDHTLYAPVLAVQSMDKIG